MEILTPLKACISDHKLKCVKERSESVCSISYQASPRTEVVFGDSQVRARGGAGAGAASSVLRSRDPCKHCGLPVFLAERLIVGAKRQLYHRTCFRCARCQNQLTLANCYETEDGQYCCETCPDEEFDTSSIEKDRLDGSERSSQEIQRFPGDLSISDDEKISLLSELKSESAGNDDEYSAEFESNVEGARKQDQQRKAEPSPSPTPTSATDNQQLPYDLDCKFDDSVQKNLQNSVHSDSHNETFESCEPKSQDNNSLQVNTENESTIYNKESDEKSISKDIELEINVNKNHFRSDVQQAAVENEPSVICTKDSKYSNAAATSSIVKMRKKLFENDQVDVSTNNERASKKVDSTSIKDKISKMENDPENVFDVQITSTIDDKLEENDSNSSIDVAETQSISQSLMGNKPEISVSDHTAVVKPAVNPRTKIVSPTPKPRDSVPPSKPKSEISGKKGVSEYPSELNPFGSYVEKNFSASSEKSIVNERKQTKSTNPFDIDDVDEDVVLRKPSLNRPPRPPLPQSNTSPSPSKAIDRRPQTISGPPLKSPSTSRRRIEAPASLNPFWSDCEEELETSTPKPLPRTVKLTPEPRPRTVSSEPGSSLLSASNRFGSTSSLTSTASAVSTNTASRRNKKRIPAPAPPRKSRPAPKPPAAVDLKGKDSYSRVEELTCDDQKLLKDEANRIKQTDDPNKDRIHLRDKSTYGQWKRKKGPAPPRPLPQRRQIRSLPSKEIKTELFDIEVRQLELERQGVELEKIIRRKFDEAPSTDDSRITPDIEDRVLQLFELVNHKNELFRRQAELMYLRRQQRLEEEHADLEYQIRLLMEQPERMKTDSDKTREEDLIRRLVEVVERRNEIVECLEMDRKREAEEDQSINTQLSLYAAKGKSQNPGGTPESSSGKEKKEKEKKKKDKKSKKKNKFDADKDIDEMEVASAKEKKSKKKWFL